MPVGCLEPLPDQRFPPGPAPPKDATDVARPAMCLCRIAGKLHTLGIWFACKRCADETGGFYEWMLPTHSHPTTHA